MKEIRTVTLELLRHGPAHNQLLSPLTDYLALCGNHSPQGLRIPLEHRFFLGRLRSLRYEVDRDDPESREIGQAEMAELMADVLAGIPGLLSELSRQGSDGDVLVHLRLVLSSLELASLPFELATSPNGFPGAGQPLSLQSQLPLVITRQVRRVGNRPFRWPARPKILFAAAAPGADVPADRHRGILEDLLDPWVAYNTTLEDWRQLLDEHLVVLPKATLSDLEEACRRHAFSHIHLLAHGAETGSGLMRHYGLALHGPGGSGTELVPGDRLALALRAGAESRGEPGPAVVSLATCDSGNVGSVVDGGASVAHALHEAGFPMVVASQFPLSVAGSNVLVEGLYRALLWGEDPRTALRRLRRSLRIRQPDFSDWSSLVVYTSLPEDLERQLGRYRLGQASRAVNVAHDWADEMLAELERGGDGAGSMRQAFDTATLRLDTAKYRLAGMAGETAIWGRMASAEKRHAQLFHKAAQLVLASGNGPEEQEMADEYQAQCMAALKRSRDCYLRAFREDRSAGWAIAQYLCLGEALGHVDEDAGDLWTTARTLTAMDLRRATGRRLAWAYGTLAELHLLGLRLTRARGKSRTARKAEHRERALDHARKLAQMVDEHPMDIYTTRRQFLRYPWLAELRSRSSVGELLDLAAELAEALPDIAPPQEGGVD